MILRSLSARKRIINHDLIKNRGSTRSVFSFHNLILQLSYTYLRCLWKLEQGYLKLKMSRFPKFLSKTVAKLHLFLLCLGKHYIDAQRSRSIFPLSYNEFSNKSAFLFSFGGANKKVFLKKNKKIKKLNKKVLLAPPNEFVAYWCHLAFLRATSLNPFFTSGWRN